MKRYSSDAHCHAFSIVELLVVVGLIAILFAILLPTITRAREQANQTKCQSQLHQLGVAFSLYSESHNGWLPAFSGWHVYPPGSSIDDDPGVSWTEELEPYFVKPDSSVYDCPSFGTNWVTYFMSGRWAASQNRHAIKLTEIRLSSQFVLGGEDTNRHLYAAPYGDAEGRSSNDCDQDDADACCAAFPDRNGGYLQHRGGNNLLFGDMHVQAFRNFSSAQMTFDPSTMRTWDDVVPAPGFQ